MQMAHPPPGPTPAHRLALPAGYVLDGYRIQRVLGKGGFGITYLAVDVDLNMPVAIKEMLPDGIATRVGGSQVVAQSPSQEEGFRWAKKRFIDEARTLARLQHPSVVRVQRLLEANGTAYIVMEYVEGRGLDEWLKQRPRVTEAELLSIVKPLMEGLEYVHRQGLLHRDIKPENIFLTSRGRILLLDFGSARADLGKTTAMTSVVSEGYSPLEQYQTNSAQGPYTDIYALGCVMARVILGQRPATAVDRMGNPANFPPLSSRKLPGWSPSVLRAVDAALAIMPKDRVANIPAFRTMIFGASAGSVGRTAYAPNPVVTGWTGSGLANLRTPNPPQPSSSMSTAARAAIIALVSLAVGGGLFFLLMFMGGDSRNDVTVANSGSASGSPSAPAFPTPQAPSLAPPGGSTPAPSPAASPNLTPQIADEVAAARRALEAGDLDGAERRFVALRDGASTLQGHLGLADVRLERAKYDEAQRDYEFVLQLDPNVPEALLGRATVLWEKLFFVDDYDTDAVRQQISTLIQRIRALPGVSPKILTATQVLEGAFITGRDGVTPDEDQKAAAILQAAGQAGYAHPLQLFYLGDSQLGMPGGKMLSQESHQRAVRAFVPRIESSPARMRDWLYLIKLYSRLGTDEEIVNLESRFTEPEKTTPAAAAFLYGKFSWGYCNRARDDGDYQKGLAAAERGLALNAGHHNCFIGQAFALDKLKRYDEGMRACDRYLAANKSYEAQYRGITKKARFHLSKGEKDTAIATFDKALDLDRKNHEAWKGRGLFREALKDYAGAIEDYTEALRLLPASATNKDRGWYYSERGSCHYFVDNLMAAVPDFDKALELNANDPVAYLFRAYMLQDDGEHIRALDLFNKAIELNPRLIAAYRFRAKSYRALGLGDKADADEAKVKELGG